jgi:hypothetical protein
MAIIPCKECGHQISDKAAGCPNCGAPIVLETKPKPHAGRIVYGLLIVFGVVCVAAATLWWIEPPDRLMGMMRSLSRFAEHPPSPGPRVSAERSSIAVQSPLAPDAAPPLVYQTTAQQLYQDYDTNAVATQNRIGTSRIRITGTIAEIDEDAAGHPIVKLWTSNGGSAEMTLNDDQKAAAAELVKGEAVDVQCDRMRHVVASPQGSGCALVLVYAGSTSQAYLAVFMSNDRGNAPIYIAGPMSRAECLARGDGISAQLSSNQKRDRVVSKNCASTARESIPPEGCRLSSSMSAIPDMPTAHLWKYDCTKPAAVARGSGGTAAALHKAVPSIEVTNLAAAPEESAEPEAQTTAAPGPPGEAVAATPAVATPRVATPVVAAAAVATPTVATPTVALPGPTPTPIAAASQNSILHAAAAVTPGDSAAVQANVSNVSDAPSAGAEPAAAATASSVSAAPANAATAPNVSVAPGAAATASNVSSEPAAPSDLLTVRTADPGAAAHIASYCKGASAAATDRDAVAAGCRREEVGAWTRLVLHNEFPGLDEATRRKCNQPPFPDSYVAKESCAKYELRIN